MKKKPNTILVSIFFVILLSTIAQANILDDLWLYFFPNSDDVISKYHSNIRLEDADNIISIELETTGLSPTSQAVIDIDKLSKKKINGKFDLIVISPKPMGNIKATSWKETTETTIRDVYDKNGNYVSTITYDTLQGIRQKDITSKILHNNFTTIYGNYQYYLKNEDFKANKPDKYRFEVSPNINDLPIKYTVCLGDITNQATWFCLDPTITDSRTWTVNADFTNGTIINNITTSSDQIELTSSAGSSGYTLFYNETFEGKTIGQFTGAGNNGTGTWSIATSGCKQGSNCLRLTNPIDAQGGKYIDNSTFNLNVANNNYTIKGWVQDVADGGGTNAWGGILINWQKGMWNGTSPDGFDFTDHANTNCYLYHKPYSLLSANITSGLCGAHTWRWFEMTIENKIVAVTIWTDNTKTTTLVGTANMLGGQLAHDSGYFGYVCGGDCIFDGVEWYVYQSGATTYNTQGLYSDRQGWSPQTNNMITNLSTVVTTTGTGTVQFRYNNTNTSLDTSLWITLSVDGVNNIDLNLSTNDTLFYQYMFTDTGSSTPLITSYTFNEANMTDEGTPPSDSCTYTSGTWIIQGSDGCNITTPQNMLGNNILFNGTGTIRIQNNFTNCGTIISQGVSSAQKINVVIENGARFCD